MAETAADRGRFAEGLHTVAVFKDLEWARRGADELRRRGFPAEAISILAKPGEGLADWAAQVLGRPAAPATLPRLGDVIAAGPLLDTLDGGTGHLVKVGLSGAITRAGFQPHDGQIFETLVDRGGVLMAIRSEPRAADALAVFHSYGGANAAIGAWSGRV